MHHEYALDRVGLVGSQRLLDALGVGARPPLLVLHDDIEAVPAGKLAPQMAELAETGDEDFVAWRQRVGEGSLPGAGAARREDDDLPLFGLEDSLQPLVKRQGQLGEVR
jgi:hypothetical protein